MVLAGVPKSQSSAVPSPDRLSQHLDKTMAKGSITSAKRHRISVSCSHVFIFAFLLIPLCVGSWKHMRLVMLRKQQRNPSGGTTSDVFALLIEIGGFIS